MRSVEFEEDNSGVPESGAVPNTKEHAASKDPK
jgi:hypothetical protein